MLKFSKFFVLVLLIVLFVPDNRAQVYNPTGGETIWHLPGDVIVVYDPSNDGTDVHVCRGRSEGPCEITHCDDDAEKCKDIIEDADDGKVPPADDGGDDSGGDSGEESTQAFRQVVSEFHQFRKGKKARVFFRSNTGKWTVITNTADWKKKILSSL